LYRSLGEPQEQSWMGVENLAPSRI
jgi:hypothetical protein